MLKKIDKIIAMIMNLYLIFILFNKYVGAMTILFSIILIIRVLKERKGIPIILGIVILNILVYNYKISQQYFYLELEILNRYSNKDYFMRMILFILMLYIYSNKNILKEIYKEFKKYINFVSITITVYEVVIFFLFITKKGFVDRWGMRAFAGLNGSPHANTYLMILISILIEWIINEKNNKRYIVLYIIPFVAAFTGGARTPTIAMIGLFLGIRLFKSNKISKLKITWKKVLLINLFFILLIILSSFMLNMVLKSNVVEKFINTSDNGNVLNSRDKIWNGIINEYNNNFSTKEKLLGHGIHYTVIINENNVKSEIWGHSDFIDIMVSYGAIMLIIYIILYLRYFIKLYLYGKKVGLILTFFITMILLSTFNGVINYSIFISSIAFSSIFYMSFIENDSNKYSE